MYLLSKPPQVSLPKEPWSDETGDGLEGRHCHGNTKTTEKIDKGGT